MDLLDLNYELQKEGQELLDKLELIEYLQAIGPIEIGGSFRYGTMVDRDIDIAVVVDKKKLNKDLFKKVCLLLVSFKELRGIEITNSVEHQKIGAPLGYWFGPIFMFKGNRWNIDIWFITKDEPKSHINLELHKRMLKVTNNQREEILTLKHQALVSGKKTKGTSAQIYEQVLSKQDELLKGRLAL